MAGVDGVAADGWLVAAVKLLTSSFNGIGTVVIRTVLLQSLK